MGVEKTDDHVYEPSSGPHLQLPALTWLDMQNYRDPPPYPGHSKQVFTNQPGFRQSFSGSETSTDVSLSSTENLATSQRQEPQGEETVAPSSLYNQLDLGPGDSYSILARLGMPPGAIEAAGKGHPNRVMPSPLTSQGHLTVPQWQGRDTTTVFSHGQCQGRVDSTNSLSRKTLDFSSSKSLSMVTALSTVYSAQPGHGPPTSSSLAHGHLQPPVSSYHHRHPYVNQSPWSSGGGSDDVTSSSPNTTLAPPPDYPGNRTLTPRGNPADPSVAKSSSDIRTCRSYEMMDKVERVQQHAHHQTQQQRSHPDLRLCSSSPGIFVPATEDGEGRAVVELLTQENRTLREELAAAAIKIHKLHKLEMEIHKVHESHEGLVKSSQKQEVLWQAMKRKLEERIQTLEASGASGGSTAGTKEHPKGGSNPNLSASTVTETEFRAKVAEKDAIISKLLSQNQEMSMCRDQLEGENAQLSLSVSEQRAHVDILENALLNAQSKVLALEEDYTRTQAYADKVAQLQEALTSLQAASEKQEKRAQEMRERLEQELESYRSQDKSCGPKRLEAGKEDSRSISMLRKMLEEKDSRILQLETQMAGLEQKYVKEATLRQLHMEEKSQAPKEVRLAALEKSSSDMEKMIDEAKTEKLKHMEELHQSQRKVAELEAKVKQLQTQLVEKEAMVKVFQRSPMARSSSLHALCHPSMPRPLLGGHSSWSQGAPRDLASIRHVKTGSTSALEMGRKMSVEEDLLNKVQSLSRGSETKSDSEEEVKLWHV